MKVVFKIIYDNGKHDPALTEGWGFSLLAEVGDRTILFDTGNDRKAFYSNAEKMGIDLGKITDVMFSHKHDDHVAGCEEILGKVAKDCRVFVPKGFPSKKIPRQMQTQFVSNFEEIGEGIYSMVLKGGLFLYEQCLILRTPKGLAIVTGCAHPGIAQIVQEAKKRLNAPIHFVLGGFHLFKQNSGFIEKTVKEFQNLQVKRVAPCHCSGKQTMQKFQEAFQEDFCTIGTGSVVTL